MPSEGRGEQWSSLRDATLVLAIERIKSVMQFTVSRRGFPRSRDAARLNYITY